jgi:phage-related protein
MVSTSISAENSNPLRFTKRIPQVRRLEGKLWEMRLTGRDGIARALYVTALVQRVVVVRAFVKKTQKTPRAEIALALRRAQEIA